MTDVVKSVYRLWRVIRVTQNTKPEHSEHRGQPHSRLFAKGSRFFAKGIRLFAKVNLQKLHVYSQRLRVIRRKIKFSTYENEPNELSYGFAAPFRG